MIVSSCTHTKTHKHGKNSQGHPRFKCVLCGETFVDRTNRPLGEMRTSPKQAATAIALFLEGMSVRSVQRLTGLCRQTLADLILQVGANCQRLLDTKVVGVVADQVSVDELWSFNGIREKHRAAKGYSEEFGDAWTFVAVERYNKMILAHQVGKRDGATCCAFLMQLNNSTKGRFQLSSDGFRPYQTYVPFVLGNRVDFGVLIKTYAAQQEVTRYAPAQIISAERKPQYGNPDYEKISTSHSEVLNRQIRQSCGRRYQRLTNAHSKSLKHHVAMTAIFVCWYNFARVHETIKTTPAMAAGLTDRKWTIREMIEQVNNG